MAKDLNVSLGLLVQNFEKGLKSASRSLRQFSRRTERIGRTLTNSLSIPLAGTAVAAIKSAADFEKLELALAAVSGSADFAKKRIDELRKEAERPGLGFEQAVRADLAFQGLGISANQSIEAIRGVGKLVASSGGGAQAFEGVVRQLNQIQAKNRVLQEDLNIILENAPTIGTVLQETFGGKTAEAIRNAGVDGEEFFQKLTKGLNELPDVESGLFNTFENIVIAVRSFLNDIGSVITELFPVQKAIEGLSSVLDRAGKGFRNLSEPVQRTIIAVAAVAAAIGPLTLGISAVAAGLAAVLSPISLAVIAIGGLIAAFTALFNLNQTFRDSVEVLALVIKTVVINAFELLSSIVSSFVQSLGLARRGTRDATNEFQEFGAKSVFSLSGVINAFETLAKVVFFPVRILKGLQSAIVSVFNTIIEKGREINRALSAGLDAANPVQALKQTIKALAGVNVLRPGAQLGGAFADGFAEGFDSVDVGGFFDNVRRDVSRAQERINAARFDRFTASQAVSPELPQDPAEAATVGATGVAGNALRTFTESIPLLQSGLTAVQSTSESVTTKLNESFLRVGEALTSSIERTNALEAAQKKYNTALAVTNTIASTISEAFGKMFSVILNGGKNAFGAFTDAIKQIVKELIIAVAKLAAFALISSILFPGGGGFATIFKGGLSNLLRGGATPFASGGIVTQSTFANVGEQGAEAIIPLDRVSDFMKPQELQLRVEGTELVALIKNSEDTYNRIF